MGQDQTDRSGDGRSTRIVFGDKPMAEPAFTERAKPPRWVGLEKPLVDSALATTADTKRAALEPAKRTSQFF